MLCPLSHTQHLDINHRVSSPLLPFIHHTQHTTHQHHRSPLTPPFSHRFHLAPPGSTPLFGTILTMATDAADGCAAEHAVRCMYMACWSCADRVELRPRATAASIPSFPFVLSELCQSLLRPEFDVSFQLAASDAAHSIHIHVNKLSCACHDLSS